ncbi:MAG: hypothetical protein A3C58_03525 [Candidatus Staskawiczbacteria bacterium RIFCSPHIGHO2_02_FULL_34_10]|uniref:Cell division protein FtsX n=2 Tax=Candidatus Staskawicziibacteriota TaxID=1817916 RepID=A0A1G2HJ46_9BACT|nr:MAG: hypothetical protein A2639_01230 [Candidatus Staskawiczbacteria bacterium RIFCSPHIGHO2_01_FULL_34_27]OGZ66374.1 MAG: hypothetical protein A3C58_03525 [Candidatus Staskawiczbacteria bacterium RIFCSPHIGHO2_02_FULL_34_10]
MLTNFKRVLRFAFADFYRNKGISIAAIFVLVITTLLITGLFFMQGISDFIILQVKDKIDITAYFKSDTQEQDILIIKDEILKASPDIKNIEYVSQEDALNDFTEKHKGNTVFSKALIEVGNNPFLPSLNITTTGDTLQYENISNIIQQSRFSDFIEKVDFSQKKDTIEKIFSITKNISRFGLGLAIILILVAVLVVFNTLKLVVDKSKEEISTMRIVGASSWFVRAPFIFQGVIFGCISFVVCFLVTILLSYLLSSGLSVIMPGFSLSNYFASNLFAIILIQLGFGVIIGVVSSFIVVNKYLKV